jgi:Ca2+-binding EF-hand superfamily protein
LGDWDKNGDAKLDQNEFSRALNDTHVFKSADVDGNGVISKKEWEQYLESTGFHINYSTDDVGTWNIWDVNNNGILSKKEFYQGIFRTVDNGSNNDIDNTINNKYAHDRYIENG